MDGKKLKLHGSNELKQTETHSVGLLVPEHRSLEANELRKYKLPHTNQIPVELSQAGVNTLRSEIHKLTAKQ
jgi:hypothetical protein